MIPISNKILKNKMMSKMIKINSKSRKDFSLNTV